MEPELYLVGVGEDVGGEVRETHHTRSRRRKCGFWLGERLDAVQKGCVGGGGWVLAKANRLVSEHVGVDWVG